MFHPYADELSQMHGTLLLSDETSDLPKESLAGSHVLMALAHMELAVQNLRAADIHLKEGD